LPRGFPTKALYAFLFSSMRALKGPSFLSIGYRSSFPGVKRLAHEVNHSRPSSAKVKKEESYTSTPPVCLHGVDRHSSAHRSSSILYGTNRLRSHNRSGMGLISFRTLLKYVGNWW
jgi:hypothetical protein